MARIAGIDLPNEKRVEIGLTYIYGIGRHTANEILKETKINPDTRVKDLTEDEVGKIRAYIEKNCVVEGDLQREVSLNIKRLQEIGCYRVFVIERTFLFVVKILNKMLELEKVLRKQFLSPRKKRISKIC